MDEDSNCSVELMDIDLSGSSSMQVDVSSSLCENFDTLLTEPKIEKSECNASPITSVNSILNNSGKLVKEEISTQFEPTLPARDIDNVQPQFPERLSDAENDDFVFCEDSTKRRLGSNIQASAKKFHIKLKNRQRTTNDKNVIVPNDIRTFQLSLIVSVLFAIFLSIVMYRITSSNCFEEVDVETLRISLSDKLYGQSSAIDNICKTLNVKAKQKILFIYGGTGVGKTYSTSILLQNISSFSNVYHYTMPSFVKSFSSHFSVGIASCKTSLVIVDDLRITDIEAVSYIVQLLERSHQIRQTVTLILIYNCDDVKEGFVKNCDKSFETKLQELYKDASVSMHFIKFQRLNEEHLLKCIESELKGQNIYNYDVETILKNFNVSLDGCKGVHSKMKLVNYI